MADPSSTRRVTCGRRSTGRPTDGDSSRRAAASVLADCRARGPVSVTAYVAPGGAVLAAGASVPDQAMAESLDCVSDAVRAWEMPDPGSYPAKVTFLLQ